MLIDFPGDPFSNVDWNQTGLYYISNIYVIFQMIPGHGSAVTALSFSPDGKYLASYCMGENKLSFWQVIFSLWD